MTPALLSPTDGGLEQGLPNAARPILLRNADTLDLGAPAPFVRQVREEGQLEEPEHLAI
jgi:hypothetical protein